ncbi:MAG: S9 family peptidase [Rhodococcus sp.]|nr:S9 family peptidase [Rhodococcus sp. (in: high G+C Gram-positive bacteria)]
MTIAPYGSWTSPISAADLAASGHPADGGRFVGDQLWWAELRPAEEGRIAIRTHVDGELRDVLPAPWNARTRVHEYGGGAWTVTGSGQLVFTEFSDQRMYRLVDGEPTPLTPAPAIDGGLRYGDLCVVDDAVWAVRESHDGDGRIVRDIVTVPLDGSAANDGSRVRSVVGGSDFLAYPRVSPDRQRVAWIAWNHPQMPWDGTELRVIDLATGHVTTVIGGTEESVLQPEWLGNDQLYAISDRSGWWNLYRVSLDGSAQALREMAADFGGPLWMLGTCWYRPRPDGTLLTVRTVGTDTLGILDPQTGELTDVDFDGLSTISVSDMRGDTVLARTGGAHVPSGVRLLHLSEGVTETVRLSVAELPDPAYLPQAQPLTIDGPRREVHVIAYPPRNPEYSGTDGEAPPYVAFVHGGPTAHVAPALNPVFAFFTSRGIGVVDVNYGGSTGYGREYRNRLRGQWGVVDVEDVVTAVRGLAELGMADPKRLVIEGGSAGGWTVLAALTTSDVFACGTSYYGVAELEKFVQETHDFESRYIDGLIGPLPEAAALYAERAPLSNVDGLDCPVLLLQGLDDPIVPPSQAERFRDALVAKGIPHAYIAYEGESHGFRRAETQISARNAELSFYGQVLGFETPGVPKLELWRP